MTKKYSKLLLSFLLVILLAFSISFGALGASLNNVPYKNYTYWDNYGSKTPVETKAVYEPTRIINGNDLGIGSFSEIQHLFTYNDSLYVLDSANGRIVILDSDYVVKSQITSLTFNGQKISIVGAKGLFVDNEGIIITDTANKRIVCLDNNCTVKKIITAPNDPSIPDSFDFAPLKIVKDSYGYYYLLCEGSYYGMMVFDNDFIFSGFFGANNVTSTFSDAIKEFIVSLFETDEKHSNSVQALPFSLLDICLDNEGFLLTVNSEITGQIRRFGLEGKNILKKTTDFTSSSTDSYNFADSPVMYLDKTSKYNTYITCAFTSIASDDKGFIYAIEATQGRIYMYDSDCNLISVFGGGLRNGSQMGTFCSPDSICCFKSDLLISDFSTGYITIFKPTDYGRTLIRADMEFVKNNYFKAKDDFIKIYNQDKNCQIAIKGIARAYLKEGNYKKAMEYAKLGIDKKTYAKAFEKVRADFIAHNFWWMFIITLFLICGLCYLLFFKKSKANSRISNSKVKVCLDFLFHPIDSLNEIRYKNNGSILISSILLFLFFLSQIFSTIYGGFVFSSVNLSTFNAILTLLGTIGVILLWVVSSWLVCILFDGKGRLKEIYCSTCLCLIPLIFYNISYLFFSNVLVPTTNSGFELFKNICYIITAIFIVLSVMVIEDFTFFKALGLSLVVIIAMAIVAFVLFIMLTLWQDLISFVTQIVNEATMR